MNNKELVKGIYKQATDDILSKIKAAIGAEDRPPAIDTLSGAATGLWGAAGAFGGSTYGNVAGRIISARKLAEKMGTPRDVQRTIDYLSKIQHRRGLDAANAHEANLIDRRISRALSRGGRMGKFIGGAWGGLTNAAVAYALTNPRTRAKIAQKFNK